MTALTSQSTVDFLPFTRQVGEEETVIGRPETGIFLALPNPAMEIVDLLREGASIQEAGQDFERRYGEYPDVLDLVEALRAKGFVSGGPTDDFAAAAPLAMRYHFADIPVPWARRLFHPLTLGAAGLIVASAAAVMALEPSLRPSWHHLFFEEHMTSMILLMMGLGVFVTACHEMAHLLAARSKGVSCRLGIGNRLWMLVAETDMTGVWSLPRRDRYLPILAGPINDAVWGSLCVLALYACQTFEAGSPLLIRVLQAMVVVYGVNILWQCHFFVRTDFYFVYTTAFDCKNLMRDTKQFLRNRMAALLGRPRPFDQSDIPEREMRAIRRYSVFWLVGRAVAFTFLFVFVLPLTWRYALEVGSKIVHLDGQDTYAMIDALIIGGITLTSTVAGFWMWIQSIRRSRSQS